MQKIIAILLLIITITCNVVPCCANDNCGAEEAKILLDGSHGDDRDQGTCSPFFSCSTCIGGIETGIHQLVVVPVLPVQAMHLDKYSSALSAYDTSFFQPPRILEA